MTYVIRHSMNVPGPWAGTPVYLEIPEDRLWVYDPSKALQFNTAQEAEEMRQTVFQGIRSLCKDTEWYDRHVAEITVEELSMVYSAFSATKSSDTENSSSGLK